MATILVVDDAQECREYLRALLGYVGHSVLEAAGGAEALALARRSPPDLVISDLVMPGGDGFELASALRAQARIPFIFCTATYLEREASELARLCGAQCVLMKPCEPEALLDAVRGAVRGALRKAA